MKRNEFALHDWIKDNLSNYFVLKHEHQSGKNRPDFIATCKETGFTAIIEVKDATVFRGSEVFDWLQQCRRYSKHFNYPVFVFPQISHRIFDEGVKVKTKHGQHQHNNVSTFLGRFGIGEISITNETQRNQFGTIEKYVCIQFYHSGWVIWSNRYDLREGISLNIDKLPKRKEVAT